MSCLLVQILVGVQSTQYNLIVHSELLDLHGIYYKLVMAQQRAALQKQN